MKKLIPVLLSFFIVQTSVADVVYAIGGGLNLNTLNPKGGTGYADAELTANLAFKSKLEVGFAEQWLLRTGLWLQQKSAKYSVDEVIFGERFDGDLTMTTTYASIPLNVQFQAFERVGFFGGYIADIRLDDKCTDSGDFDDLCKTSDENSKSIVHLATAGLSILVGSSANIDVSRQQGLTDVMKDAYKIHTFSVDGYYRF